MLVATGDEAVSEWGRMRRICRYTVAGHELLNPAASKLKVLNIGGPDGTSVSGCRVVGASLSVPGNVCVAGVVQVKRPTVGVCFA